VFVVSQKGIWQYTPQDDVWNFDVAEPPIPVGNNIGFSILESYIYILGGKNSSSVGLNTNLKYQAIYSLVFPLIKNQ